MTTTTGVLCIDADGHVRDTDEDIRGYLDAPYNERPRLSGGAPRDGFDNTLGNRAGTRVVDTAVWIDALDRGGLDASVLYPTGSLVSGWLREPDFAVARARAYNSWLFDTYLDVDSRFKGVAMLPVQNPAAAAVELRRAVNELGMLGGMLPEGPYLFGKPEFDVLYEEAERLGVPLAVHASGRITGSYDEFLFDNLAQVHSLGHAFVQMKQFVSIVLSGVPEKFPALKLAFLEAGCGWAVFMLDRMDERYHLRGHVDAPLLTKSPSEYMASGNLFISCEAEERMLPETMRILGEDIIMFASDFPHWDAEFPENLQHLLAREDLTPSQRAKVVGLNAKRLYNIT